MGTDCHVSGAQFETAPWKAGGKPEEQVRACDGLVCRLVAGAVYLTLSGKHQPRGTRFTEQQLRGSG
jgi:hypothetical protein